MTHSHDLRELRDAMALAIARKVVAGEPVPEWAVEDFAAADAEAGYGFSMMPGPAPSPRPGAAFGL